jgi:hypothetical protein
MTVIMARVFVTCMIAMAAVIVRRVPCMVMACVVVPAVIVCVVMPRMVMRLVILIMNRSIISLLCHYSHPSLGDRAQSYGDI